MHRKIYTGILFSNLRYLNLPVRLTEDSIQDEFVFKHTHIKHQAHIRETQHEQEIHLCVSYLNVLFYFPFLHLHNSKPKQRAEVICSDRYQATNSLGFFNLNYILMFSLFFNSSLLPCLPLPPASQERQTSHCYKAIPTCNLKIKIAYHLAASVG